MKFFKCLLLFGSCMSTSSGILHGGADKMLLYSSDNGSDDSIITKELDQITEKKSNRDSYRI